MTTRSRRATLVAATARTRAPAVVIIVLNVKLLFDFFLPAAWTAPFYHALGLPTG